MNQESFVDPEAMDWFEETMNANADPYNVMGSVGLINPNVSLGKNKARKDNLMDSGVPANNNQQEVGLVNLVDSRDPLIKNEDEVRLSNPVDSGDLLMKKQDEVELNNLVDSGDSLMKNEIKVGLSNLVDSGDLLMKKQTEVGLSNLVDSGDLLNKKEDKVGLMNLVDSRDLQIKKSAKGLENLVWIDKGLCVDEHGNWRHNRYTPDTLSREGVTMCELLSRVQSWNTSHENGAGCAETAESWGDSVVLL